MGFIRHSARVLGAGVRGGVRGLLLGGVTGAALSHVTGHGLAGDVLGHAAGATIGGLANSISHMRSKHRELVTAMANKRAAIASLEHSVQRFHNKNAMQVALRNAQFEAHHHRIHGRFQ